MEAGVFYNIDPITGKKSKKKQSVRFKRPVKIEHEGKSYTGEYWVEKKIVYVEAYGPDGIRLSPRTQLGGSPPEVLAQILLREMVEAGRVEPDKT